MASAYVAETLVKAGLLYGKWLPGELLHNIIWPMPVLQGEKQHAGFNNPAWSQQDRGWRGEERGDRWQGGGGGLGSGAGKAFGPGDGAGRGSALGGGHGPSKWREDGDRVLPRRDGPR